MHPNTTFTEPEPTFESTLYGMMKHLHPSLTVRTFSVACLNRSEGYFSSVVAQGLRIPNTALIALTDYLETQKILHQTNSTKLLVINDILQFVEDEIVARFKLTTQISREAWNRLAESIREEDTEEKYGYVGYDYMPFSFSRY